VKGVKNVDKVPASPRAGWLAVIFRLYMYTNVLICAMDTLLFSEERLRF
jgi:hypothetical protein